MYRAKRWTVDNYWKKAIFSDESQTVFGTNNSVYIWRKEDDKYNPHLICSRSDRKINLMISGCVCYRLQNKRKNTDCFAV